MLKTLKELIQMLGAQKRQLYFSIFLSFVDSCLFVAPIIIAFYIIGSIPELSGDAVRPLTADMVIGYAVIMLICVAVRIILRYFTLYFRSGSGYEVMGEERKLLGQKTAQGIDGIF